MCKTFNNSCNCVIFSLEAALLLSLSAVTGEEKENIAIKS
jgi:hypothetical protein